MQFELDTYGLLASLAREELLENDLFDGIVNYEGSQHKIHIVTHMHDQTLTFYGTRPVSLGLLALGSIRALGFLFPCP